MTDRFGRLEVVGDAPRLNGRPAFLCRCDCGTEKAIRRSSLKAGFTRSCGCLRRERMATGVPQTKHGMWRHSLYSTWLNMRQRCGNPDAPNYHNYGGRGITICERWDDFANFATDMGEKPGPEYSVDRIDNDGNYEPGNCHWATPSEQSLNTRRAKARQE
jgi:hypothetical protein